jgi:uncharacterized protein
MAMHSLTRGRFVVGAGVMLAASVARAQNARDRFEVREVELRVPGMDPAHDGLKVVQLSDIHIGFATPDSRVRAAIQQINAIEPDLVVLTGDYVTWSKKPAERVGRVLAGIEPPVVAILGNHDHWVDAARVRSDLEADGYPVLQNESLALTINGAPVWVVGIDDATTGHEDIAAACAGVPERGTRIVLAHMPTTADRLPENAHLVVLSGHTHGGQLRVPGLTDKVASAVGQPYLRGLYRVRGNDLYVNPGLGFGRGGPAVRFNNPPEVTAITLRAVPASPPSPVLSPQ